MIKKQLSVNLFARSVTVSDAGRIGSLKAKLTQWRDANSEKYPEYNQAIRDILVSNPEDQETLATKLIINIFQTNKPSLFNRIFKPRPFPLHQLELLNIALSFCESINLTEIHKSPGVSLNWFKNILVEAFETNTTIRKLQFDCNEISPKELAELLRGFPLANINAFALHNLGVTYPVEDISKYSLWPTFNRPKLDLTGLAIGYELPNLYNVKELILDNAWGVDAFAFIGRNISESRYFWDWLKSMPNLTHLSLKGIDIKNSMSFTDLENLRVLDLSGSPEHHLTCINNDELLSMLNRLIMKNILGLKLILKFIPIKSPRLVDALKQFSKCNTVVFASEKDWTNDQLFTFRFRAGKSGISKHFDDERYRLNPYTPGLIHEMNFSEKRTESVRVEGRDVPISYEFLVNPPEMMEAMKATPLRWQWVRTVAAHAD